MDLEDIVLSEINQSHTHTHTHTYTHTNQHTYDSTYMFHRVVKFIDSESRIVVVSRGWGIGEGGVIYQGERFSFTRRGRSGDRMHHSVEALDITELYTFKWLLWQIL